MLSQSPHPIRRRLCQIRAFAAAVSALACAPALAQDGPIITTSTPIRFIVAEIRGRERLHDSYTLLLSDPADIAHARDLISRGLEAGQPIVVARIAPGADGANRNWRATSPLIAPEWHWHITQFEGFSDTTIEILDGTPSDVERQTDEWIRMTQGLIGFWSYTVVAELPPTPDPFCPADFNGQAGVSVQDVFDFITAWFAHDARADIDGSGAVTLNDLFGFLQMFFAGCP
jgi:hypothetical protein